MLIKNWKRRSVALGVALALLGVFTAVGFAQEGQKLPVYLIVKSKANSENGKILCETLGIKQEFQKAGMIGDTGIIAFVDEERYMFVPTKAVGKGAADEDKTETVVEAFDINAIRALKVPDVNAVRMRFDNALKRSNLLPEGGRAQTSYDTFQMFDLNGRVTLEAKLAAQTSFDLYIDNIPLIGPGARVNATFDGAGNVTQLRYALHEVRKGDSVEVISSDQAQKRFIEVLNQSGLGSQLKNVRLETKLVYYAPSLNTSTAGVILPHYEIGGTAMVGEKTIVLMSELVPAVTDAKYVPRATLTASVKDNTVSAAVKIEGGKPPYTINWGSSSAYIDKNTTSISYQVSPRASATSETISVLVTDANGVSVRAGQKLALSLRPVQRLRVRPIGGGEGYVAPRAIPAPLVGGVRDFGTENSVTNQFGNLENGFRSEMLGDGVTSRFHWTGINAWEQDFKSPEDSNWTDNADMTFYVGHGSGGGFTFEDTTHTDSDLDYDDATGAWGNGDMEWLALYSCQVLIDNWGGMNRFQRWRQEFDGLHLLLGFHTNAQANMGFSGAFAHNMVRRPFLWWHNPMKIKDAWFDAVDSDQPNDRVAVVMGPTRRNDGATDMNDYFHGKGSIGPDIRGDNIGGFWAIIHHAR
jgi:hypothetical protein